MANQSYNDFAKMQGIELLKDDIVFLKKCISLMPYNERRRHLTRYSEIWLSSMLGCEIAQRRQNEGRFKANSWIRGVVYNGSR